ncbi:MAG: glucose-6-phosphate isomerase, partial [Erysipelotrichia bacterium]|nr:glucose-6-phosphate isomerase [Erysipelotrichia bacterium]
MIRVKLKNGVDGKEILKYQKKAEKITVIIEEKTGLGNDFLGWDDHL